MLYKPNASMENSHKIFNWCHVKTILTVTFRVFLTSLELTNWTLPSS